MPHPPLRALLCLSIAALAGCDEDALRPRPSNTASPSAAPSAAPLASSTASAEAAHPAYGGPFSVVARSPDSFELYPLKGALFVDAAGFLAVLGEGPLRQSPAVMKGLEQGASGRVLGAYPEGAWLMSGKGTYRWSGERWLEDRLTREHETLLDIAAWDEDRAIAAIAVPGNDMRFVLAGGKAVTALPVPSAADAHRVAGHDEVQPGEGPEGDEKEAPCKVRMKPRGVVLAGLPGGELYAAGYECEPLGHGGAIVERWAPKQVHGTVEALPRPESGRQPVPRGVLARSPNEVIVYGSEGVPAAPYLARFDGKVWAVDRAPLGGAIDTLAATDDGTLWAAAGGAAWKKAGAAPWEKVPLPVGLLTHAVWPRTAADVWVAARETEGKARAVLLRSGGRDGAPGGTAPDLIRLPPRNAMAGATSTYGRFFATAACDKVYVDLETLAPTSHPGVGKRAEIPKDFSWLKPIFQDELARVQPVLEDDGLAFHVGALVPSRDVGRRLMAAYQEKRPRAKPNLFCHEPAIVKQAKLP